MVSFFVVAVAFTIMVMVFMIMLMIMAMTLPIFFMVMLATMAFTIMVVMVVLVVMVMAMAFTIMVMVFMVMVVMVMVMVVMVMIMTVAFHVLIQLIVESSIVKSVVHHVLQLVFVYVQDCTHECEVDSLLRVQASMFLDPVFEVGEVQRNSGSVIEGYSSLDVAQHGTCLVLDPFSDLHQSVGESSFSVCVVA